MVHIHISRDYYEQTLADLKSIKKEVIVNLSPTDKKVKELIKDIDVARGDIKNMLYPIKREVSDGKLLTIDKTITKIIADSKPGIFSGVQKAVLNNVSTQMKGFHDHIQADLQKAHEAAVDSWVESKSVSAEAKPEKLSLERKIQIQKQYNRVEIGKRQVRNGLTVVSAGAAVAVLGALIGFTPLLFIAPAAIAGLGLLIAAGGGVVWGLNRMKTDKMSFAEKKFIVKIPDSGERAKNLIQAKRTLQIGGSLLVGGTIGAIALGAALPFIAAAFPVMVFPVLFIMLGTPAIGLVVTTWGGVNWALNRIIEAK